jgi:hypothetical protein
MKEMRPARRAGTASPALPPDGEEGSEPQRGPRPLRAKFSSQSPVHEKRLGRMGKARPLEEAGVPGGSCREDIIADPGAGSRRSPPRWLQAPRLRGQSDVRGEGETLGASGLMRHGIEHVLEFLRPRPSRAGNIAARRGLALVAGLRRRAFLARASPFKGNPQGLPRSGVDFARDKSRGIQRDPELAERLLPLPGSAEDRAIDPRPRLEGSVRPAFRVDGEGQDKGMPGGLSELVLLPGRQAI